jgi:hypothetical protein
MYILPDEDNLSGSLKGYIHQHKIPIIISVSSTNSNPNRKFNPTTDSTDRWASLDTDIGEWYSITLLKHKLFLTNYSLFSYNYSDHRPITWVVEGKNETAWYNITTEYINPIPHNYTFSVPILGPFHTFRLTNLGKNHNNNYHFCIYKIEFYGILIRTETISHHCKLFYYYHSLLNIYSIFLLL